MDYIEKHIDQPIDLYTLSQIAHFSPYHFHRIFTVMIGETPNFFLQRIRVEKAAQLLRDEKQTPISDIAYYCGFNNISSFSRTFRKYFATTPKEFRYTEKPIFVKDGVRFSKIGKVISKDGQVDTPLYSEFCCVELKKIIIMDTKVEIKEMPEMKVVYCRHTGQFNQIYKAYEKVMRWAGPRGLLRFPETKTITVYHDDPAITSIDKVRQDACITVNEDVKVDGEIGKMTISSGKYAVGRFEIEVTEFEQAWNTMCLWLTESGYEPGDGSPYELYYNDHNQHPEKKFILDICIPIKPL